MNYSTVCISETVETYKNDLYSNLYNISDSVKEVITEIGNDLENCSRDDDVCLQLVSDQINDQTEKLRLFVATGSKNALVIIHAISKSVADCGDLNGGQFNEIAAATLENIRSCVLDLINPELTRLHI